MAVLLLKKGVQKLAAPATMKQFIEQLKKDELDEHFEAEETSLLQFAEKYPQLKPLFNKMREEHSVIRQCYRELETPSYLLIEKFYCLLEQHIRFEEREFFPLVEDVLNENELKNIGQKLSHLHHESCTGFPVKFWE